MKSNENRLSRIISRAKSKSKREIEPIKADKIPEMDLINGIIGWETQDDPDMPLNFSKGRKWGSWVLLRSCNLWHRLDLLFSHRVCQKWILNSKILAQFLVPWASQYYFRLWRWATLSIALSEVYGRRPILAAGNVFFTLLQIGCALAPNINTLIAFAFWAVWEARDVYQLEAESLRICFVRRKEVWLQQCMLWVPW